MTDPVDDLYFPATHDMHGPPFGPVDPRLQVQAARDEAPADPVVLEFVGQAMHVVFAEAPTAVEYVPAPQSVQRADPGDALYFPATHVKQGPPFGPEDPIYKCRRTQQSYHQKIGS